MRMLKTLAFVGALCAALFAGPAIAQQGAPTLGIDRTGATRSLSVFDLSNGTFVPFGALDTANHRFIPVAPTTTSRGGVQAVTPVTSNFLTGINTSGVPSLAQPAFTDISGTLPNSQLATAAAHTVKCNNTGSTAAPTDCTAVTVAGVAINPTALTTGQALSTSQSGPAVGNITGPFIYNQIAINDNSTVITDTRTMGLYMQMNTGGAASKGGIYGAFFNLRHNVASSTNGDHIALVSQAVTSVADTSGGQVYGMNSAAVANSGANTPGLVGQEIDTQVDSGATVTKRYGLRLVNQGATRATTDAAIALTSTTGGGSFSNGIYFSTEFGASPIAAAGSFINSDGVAQTLANFVALPNTTITNNIFAFPNFTVSGGGVIVAPVLANGSSLLQLGTSSGTLMVGGTGMYAANGAVATTMTSLGPTGSHTTIQKWLKILESDGTTTGYIPIY